MEYFIRYRCLISAYYCSGSDVMSKVENLATKIRNVLLYDFNITHPTFQFECTPYEEARLLCSKAKDTIDDEIKNH